MTATVSLYSACMTTLSMTVARQSVDLYSGAPYATCGGMRCALRLTATIVPLTALGTHSSMSSCALFVACAALLATNCTTGSC